MLRKLAPVAIAVIAAVAAPSAFAQAKGDWAIGVGVHNVDPKSDNGKLLGNTTKLEVESSARPTITAEYFVADNLGIEVIAAWPFEHDLKLAGLGTVGSTKQLPPTVSLQYHFGATSNAVRPFIGAGVNYTTFFSTDAEGAIAGNKLKIDDSWGLAAHAGLDFQLDDRSAIRVDARWIDIDADVKLNGQKIGTANIDPIVYGAAYVFTF